jgi:CBS domain-containing protein
MTVRSAMTPATMTVEATDSLRAAERVLRLAGIRHLPVVSDRRLVGILTARDILCASGAGRPLTGAVHVRDAMTAAVVTISVHASVREAGERILRHRVGCLVVLDRGTPVGVITASDVLAATAPCTASSMRAEERCPVPTVLSPPPASSWFG